MRVTIISLIFLACITGCRGRSSGTGGTLHAERFVPMQYAKGFAIVDCGAYRKIIIRDVQDTGRILAQYILLPRGQTPPDDSGDIPVIRIPVHTIAAMSTTQIGFLHALGLDSALVAFHGTKYIFAPSLRDLASHNYLHDLGNDNALNYELLLKLHPDMVLVYSASDPQFDHFAKLRSLGLLPVVENEFLENTPLGEAEWIRCIAAFFGKDSLAGAIFDSVAAQYRKLKTLAAAALQKPTVFTGLAYEGTWTVSGGASFAARLIEDAGADYIWEDDNKTGNFSVSYEEVLARALHADFWINPGSAQTLGDISADDPKNENFTAWQRGMVFNNNRRVSVSGANDYWESGAVHPDYILWDLISVFHPDLMPGHSFFYYQQLH